MRGGDVVVVGFNYRVGALGFLDLTGIGGESWSGSVNLGLQDQVAALHWVRRNIARFGDDPDNVSLFGGSAGASSVGCLLAIPSARGLFRRAMLMSPPVARIYAPATARRLAADLLDTVGARRPEQLLDLPVEDIRATQTKIVPADMGARALPGGRSWGPVLDGAVLPRTPVQAAEAGDTAGVPLLIGANRDEMLAAEAFEQPGATPPTTVALHDEIAGAVGEAAARGLLNATRPPSPTPPPRGCACASSATTSTASRPPAWPKPTSAPAAPRTATSSPLTCRTSDRHTAWRWPLCSATTTTTTTRWLRCTDSGPAPRHSADG